MLSRRNEGNHEKTSKLGFESGLSRMHGRIDIHLTAMLGMLVDLLSFTKKKKRYVETLSFRRTLGPIP